MSDENALLAAIWAHPHDDTVRLVYADWLQENGQPERAEFIRVQIEAAHFDEWDDLPRKEELEKREKQLWTKHAKTWKAELPKLLQAAPFRRGFPYPRRRAVTGAQFLKLTPADLAAAPLWDFHIQQSQKTLARVVASEAMSRVGVLELPINELIGRAAEVLSAANFPNVSELELNASWIGEPGIAALVANPTIRRLRALSIYSGDVNDAAAALLASAPWFSSLRALHLGNNPFDAAGLRALIASAGSGLRDLGLVGLTVGGGVKRFDDDSLLALFRAPHLAQLRALNLGINYEGDCVVELLCSDATPFRLKRLNLNNNGITDAGVARLVACPGVGTIETLDLSSNQIGPRGARALIDTPHLTRLRSLWLANNPISGAMSLSLFERFGDAVKLRW